MQEVRKRGVCRVKGNKKRKKEGNKGAKIMRRRRRNRNGNEEDEKKEIRERDEKGEGRRWKQNRKIKGEKYIKDCISRKSELKKNCYDVHK